MNPLDRAIAWFSPQAGLRRAAARGQLSILSQKFDGASVGRRTEGWIAPSTSANAELLSAQSRLAARSRDLVRNDELIINAKRQVRHYAVGSGIELQLSDPKWQALWDAFVKQSDADGQLTFHGQQSLGAGTIFESGSVLMRRRRRRLSDGLPVPMQLQILEPDHLDVSRDGPRDNGGWIQGGIEFDPLGRRVAYWLYPVHPGEVGAFAAFNRMPESKRVPASEVAHVYVYERPGQITGIPWTSAAMITARDLGDYQGAELYRKKIEACNVGAVTQAQGLGGPGLGPTPSGSSNSDDPRPEQFEPGQFFYFGPGDKVEFNDPKGNAAYEPYVRSREHRISAGLGVPYDKASGDLSQANFVSLRAGGNTFERGMDVFRWITLIPGMCDTALRWFFEAAETAGVSPGDRPTAKWQPPPYPEVEPVKEATARLMNMRSGVETPQSIIRSRGGDPREQLLDIAEWNEDVDSLGIVLDSDPRKVTRAGVEQPSDQRTSGDDDDE